MNGGRITANENELTDWELNAGDEMALEITNAAGS